MGHWLAIEKKLRVVFSNLRQWTQCKLILYKLQNIEKLNFLREFCVS